jgi:hypothetical protein
VREYQSPSEIIISLTNLHTNPSRGDYPYIYNGRQTHRGDINAQGRYSLYLQTCRQTYLGEIILTFIKGDKFNEGIAKPKKDNHYIYKHADKPI